MRGYGFGCRESVRVIDYAETCLYDSGRRGYSPKKVPPLLLQPPTLESKPRGCNTRGVFFSAPSLASHQNRKLALRGNHQDFP